MNKARGTVLVIGAGTGGHIIPGIQIGRELARRGWNVEYACGDRAVETRIYAGEEISPNVVSWPGSAKGLREKFARLVCIGRSPARAWEVLSRVRPDAVISMGGGFSAPLLALALVRGIPIWLHESNSVPGRVTRLFAPLAKRVFTGLPVPQRWSNRMQVGTPTRELPAWAPDANVRILVMGGSQGAKRLNECVVEAARAIERMGSAVNFTIVGPKVEGAPQSVTFVDYLANPLAALASSTIAISRAGASSLAEIAGIGVPSILVPYPFAKDDHQTRNARVLADCGGAVMHAEAGLSGHALAARIAGLLADHAELRAMSRAVLTLAAPRAAEQIADAIEDEFSAERGIARPSRITRETPT